MATTIPYIHECDLAQISIAAPKVMENKGKILYIKHMNSPFIFKTYEMVTPYGLSDWDNTKFYLNLSIDDNDIGNKFKSSIEAFENLIIDYAFDNSQTLFRKTYPSKDVIKELFSSSINASSSKYQPTIKFQVPYIKNKFNCDAYDYKKNTIDISKNTITKGSKASVIVHCTGIWVAGSKFGCTYKVVQMKVASKINLFDQYAFQDDSDEES